MYTQSEKRKRKREIVLLSTNFPDMTQEELADKYGISQARVSQILKNKKGEQNHGEVNQAQG